MKNPKKRLDKLEEKYSTKQTEPVFVHWQGHPWTEKEKAVAIQADPTCRMFWKPLSLTIPTEEGTDL